MARTAAANHRENPPIRIPRLSRHATMPTHRPRARTRRSTRCATSGPARCCRGPRLRRQRKSRDTAGPADRGRSGDAPRLRWRGSRLDDGRPDDGERAPCRDITEPVADRHGAPHVVDLLGPHRPQHRGQHQRGRHRSDRTQPGDEHAPARGAGIGERVGRQEQEAVGRMRCLGQPYLAVVVRSPAERLAGMTDTDEQIGRAVDGHTGARHVA